MSACVGKRYSCLPSLLAISRLYPHGWLGLTELLTQAPAEHEHGGFGEQTLIPESLKEQLHVPPPSEVALQIHLYCVILTLPSLVHVKRYGKNGELPGVHGSPFCSITGGAPLIA
jgi:hypothetical protein